MSFIKGEMLLRHYPKLKTEIEKSIDLGKHVSISPLYTFYYSKSTGVQYIKNTELIRVYSELIPGHYSPSAYIIFECKGNKLRKISGNVDYLEMRTAYDTFCPQILIGAKGREMDIERLRMQCHVRRRSLFISLTAFLCWTLVCSAAKYLSIELSIFVFTAATIIAILIFIMSLHLVLKDK